MNCDPASLSLASARYSALPKKQRQAAQIYLLCAWANAGGGPPCTLPSKAISPGPASGATRISAASPILSWANGGGATSYNVYFNGAYAGNTAGTTFTPGPLSYLTTYTWRVDAVNSCGVTTGDTWSFTTVIAPPAKATTPSPANGATGVLPYAPSLSWAAVGSATGYDIWFNGVKVSSNQAGTSYTPGALAFNTAYTWRIDPINTGGTTTGDTWSFTTIAAFSYAPSSSTITWTDINAPGQTGDLAFFNAHADFTTVSNVDLDGQALTSISNLAALPALAKLTCATNSLTALDLTGCGALVSLECDTNPLTTLDISHSPLLGTVTCQASTLTVAAVNTILAQLVTFGVKGGTCYLEGQSPAASPTTGPPNGIVAAAALLAEVPAWAVLTD